MSRMAASGELLADEGNYELRGALLLRQLRQDQSRHGAGDRPWNGLWRMVIVGGEARSAADRAEFRATLLRARFAELREGVWLRPDNLGDGLEAGANQPAISSRAQWLRADLDDDDAVLAACAWDLNQWAANALTLIAEMDEIESVLVDFDLEGVRSSLADGFLLNAAVLRHLQADPLLPATLLPASWPGSQLRARFETYDAAFRAAWRGWQRR